VLNGRSTKNAFTINSQPDTNLLQATISLTVPAGKEVAVMHVHATAPMPMRGAVCWRPEESDILKGVPPELRRIIVNFNSGLWYIGDREVLRGDLLDVIELAAATS